MSNQKENNSGESQLFKPIKTLLVLLIIGAISFGVILVFPKDGIPIGDDFILVFPSIEDVSPELSVDTSQVSSIENLEEFLDDYTTEVDSIAIEDSLKKALAIKRKLLLKLQYKDSASHPLNLFFQSLLALEQDKSKHVRAIHYGDSQIEGDRITGYLRNQFQEDFGGYGPGLIPAVEVVPSAAIDQENSSNWNRYTIFGKKDTLIKHSRYGVLANFGRFTSPIIDSLSLPAIDSAWIELKPSRLTYSKSRRFDVMKIWMGNNRTPFDYKLELDDSLVTQARMEPSGSVSKTWKFKSTPENIRLSFKGADSPEVYAISLESASGIHIDNIGMRGSSGTIFKRIDRGLYKQQISQLDPKFIILQFGGNTVPYITSDEKAIEYGNWFAGQIKYLQSVCPEASFLVIGPSDMAIKEKDKFVTYPYLLAVRDALKDAALTNNCAFWDLYEVMGGQNSMEVWVNAEPALAGPDYIHFTIKGTKKVAELLHKSIEDDYLNWKKTNEKK